MSRLVLLFALLAIAACSAPRKYFSPDEPLPFSNAVLDGGILYVAGHLGLDPGTRRAPEDPAEEAELLLDSFEATLARADMSWGDLLEVQVFCSNVDLYGTFNSAYSKRFDGAFPSRAFIGSGVLLRGCRFEMLGRASKR